MYGTIPDDLFLEWDVNINGTKNEGDLSFINGIDFRKKDNISGYNLTVTVMPSKHNKTHCTEPTLISTLWIVHPILNASENILPFINISCEVNHQSGQAAGYPITETTQRHHGKLIVILYVTNGPFTLLLF